MAVDIDDKMTTNYLRMVDNDGHDDDGKLLRTHCHMMNYLYNRVLIFYTLGISNHDPFLGLFLCLCPNLFYEHNNQIYYYKMHLLRIVHFETESISTYL